VVQAALHAEEPGRHNGQRAKKAPPDAAEGPVHPLWCEDEVVSDFDDFSCSIMSRIVEWGRGHISNGKLRYALYCGLIEEFEKLGAVYHADACCKMDDQFKEAYEEMHAWEDNDG